MRTLGNQRMKPVLVAIAIGASSAAIGQQSNPITPIDVSSVFTDPAGRTTEFKTGQFGEVLGTVDTAGLASTVGRDSNGNPTAMTLPNGSVMGQTFDLRGNSTSRTDQALGGTASARYEATFNQITQVTDPLSAITTVTYNSFGNPTQLTTPEGRTLSATYQSAGLVSSLTNTLGTVTNVTYNSDQLPTQLVVGSGSLQRQAQRTYTGAGYVDTDTDPEGRVYDFDYDVLGRLTQATLPDSRNINYGYDPADNLISLTPPGRSAYAFDYNNVSLLSTARYPAVSGGGSNQTAYTYNLDRQLTQITRADGTTINLGYDNAGRIQTITQPDGNFSLSYGASTGLLDSSISPDGITLSNTYNNQLLTQVAWSGAVSGSIGYAYDAKGRITTFTIGGQNYAYAFNGDDDITQAGAQTLAYDASSGLLTGTTLDTINESFTHSQFAELIQHTVTAGATTLYNVVYTRDGLGRITRQVEAIEGTTSTTDYTYDLAGRIATVSNNSTLIATYTYDSNDNRTDHGGVYDAQDRITAQTGVIYNYNAHGERTQKTEGANTTQYQYDALGTLVGATLPNGDQVDYVLDGQSRRVARQFNGTATEAWLYGANTVNVVARLDNSNAVAQRYIYASRLQVPDYVDAGGTQYKVIANHLGSVRLVVDASDGTVVQRLDYDTWGAITADTNPNFQPFAYAGGLYDSDTELTQFGRREYGAKSTHWTNKDPIGFTGSDNNLYTYVSADPVNLIDPIGLDGITVGGVIGKVSSAAAIVGPFIPGGGAIGPIIGAIGASADGYTIVTTAKDAPSNSYNTAKFGSTVVGAVVGVTALVTGGTGPAVVGAVIAVANVSEVPADAYGRSGDIGTQYAQSAPKNIFSTRAYQALPSPDDYRRNNRPEKRFGLRNIGRCPPAARVR